jgi:nitric oxide reductase
MVSRFFTQEHVNSLKPLISELVKSHLDKLVAKGCETPLDLVEHFSLPIPSLVCWAS